MASEIVNNLFRKLRATPGDVQTAKELATVVAGRPSDEREEIARALNRRRDEFSGEVRTALSGFFGATPATGSDQGVENIGWGATPVPVAAVPVLPTRNSTIEGTLRYEPAYAGADGGGGDVFYIELRAPVK